MFFWSDTFGTCLAAVVFLLVLFVPGYVCGFGLDLFGFRRLNAGWQIITSVTLSFATVPLAGFLLLRYGGMPAVWAATGLAFSAFLWIFPKHRPRDFGSIPQAAFWIAAAWMVVGTLLLADLQFGTKVYFCATANDHEFRVAVVDAITRTGIPPKSPFNSVDGPVTMRYHVFWFGLCSIVERLGVGLLTGRHALNGSILWCGWGLMCLVALATRFLQQTAPEKLLRRTLLGVALLAVTGLDLIPNLLLVLRHTVPPSDMEWWSPDQITSWADAILWVPHHIAGIVAGLAGFILLFDAAETGRPRMAAICIAGAAFASATGCSIYVGFALAVTLTCWTLFTLLRRWYPHVIVLAAAGLAAVLLSIPNLLLLRGADTGGTFLKFALRFSLYSDIWLSALHIPEGPVYWLLQIPFLAVTYFLELGLFLLIGIVMLRMFAKGKTLTPCYAAGLTLAGSAFILCTFVRSATISNNDLGWRGFMIVQFILLLWAAELLDEPLRGMKQPPRWVPAAFLTLLIGVAGSIYQLAWLRFADVITDSGVFGTENFDTNTGARTYSLRVLYSKLDKMIPRDAIIQSTPDAYFDYWGGLYSGRQTVATGEDCTVAMGGSMVSCKKAVPELEMLFDGDFTDLEAARKIAAKYHIRAVIVMDDDDIWDASDAWTSKMAPAITERDAKAYLF